MIDCAQVRAMLRRGETPGGPEVAAHVSTCPACSELIAAPGIAGGLDAIASAATGDIDALLARTKARLALEQGWRARVRASSTGLRNAIAALVIVGIPLLVLVTSPRADLGVYPAMRLIGEGLAYVLTALAAAVLALWPLHATERPTARVGTAIAAIGAAIVIASWPAAHHDHPAALAGAGADFVPRALGCLMYGTICGLPVWLALRVLTRRGATLGGDAWLVAFAAAGSGAAAVFLHCPIAYVGHRWAGHVAVLVVLAAWAAWHVYRGRER